jgi:2,4-dienoyl-CoA reductase-like NADH-dependent reductase (Old Yellow Enzyme family)
MGKEEITGLIKLFEEVKMGNIRIKNRIAFAPTGMLAGGYDGSITDQNLCHYIARAKGGAGLIIVEHTFATDRYNRGIARILSIYNDRQLAGWKELADNIHYFGAKAVVQLSLGLGRQGNPLWDDKDFVAPSALPFRILEGSTSRRFKDWEGAVGETPRELTEEEIKELEDDFVSSAARIKRAGFDGIEIHGAHGYLIAQFVSPLSNKRQDLYGGSFEKRLTLPLNLIKKTRETVDKEFLIGYRISGDEHVDGGLTLEDTKRIVPILVDAGLDFIHLSSGRYEAFKWTIPEDEGIILREAAAIKGIAKVPVICPNIHTPRLAEKAIIEDKIDMIALSRGLLADPDWPNKVKEGRFAEIRRCKFCNNCVRLILDGFNVKCAVNPEVGRERFIPEYYPSV